MILRILTTIVVVILTAGRQSWACLRPTLDARAVQWSTLIVQAKLISGTPTADFSDPATRPVGRRWCDQVFCFEVTEMLDGLAKVGNEVKVIRFVSPDGPVENSICGQSLGGDQIGKSFVLLLRPEAGLAWSSRPTDPDPRTPQVHGLKAFIVVHLDLSDDVGPDGLADLRSLISDTRSAESQINPQQVRTLASTLAQAADDVEASESEHALLEMGPKAAEAIRGVAATAGSVGKTRLARVIDAISLPPIVPVQ